MSRHLRRVAAVLTSLPARIVITAGLLAVVGASIDWSLLEDRLAGAAWGWFVLATALVFLALLVGALRWHLLLHGAALPATLRESFRAYGIGAFSNNLLPTGFGGDAVRAWIVARTGKPLARSFTSVFADRASSYGCLLLLAWVGVAVAPGSVPGEFVALLAVATACIVVGGAVAIATLRRRGLSRLLPEVLRPWASEVARTLRAYGRDRPLIDRALMLGLAFQGLMVASFWMRAEALQLPLDLWVGAVVMALVLFATLMPVSVAGFGVREGAFVALLAQVGISTSDAVLLSLLMVASLAIGSLPGGVALLVRHEPLHLPSGGLELQPEGGRSR